MRRCVLACLMLTMTPVTAQTLTNQEYDIEILADDTGDLSGLLSGNSYPAIADTGSVVFYAQVDDLSQRIYHWDGTLLQILDSATAGLSTPGISDDGRVIAWARNSNSGIVSTLFKWTDGQAAEVDPSLAYGAGGYGNQFIPNNHGAIAATVASVPTVWDASGEATEILATDFGELVQVMPQIDFNQSGQLAFMGLHRQLDNNGTVLLTNRCTEVIHGPSTLAQDHLDYNISTSINNAGEVAYAVGFWADGMYPAGTAFFVSDGVSSRNVLSGVHGYGSQGEGPSLNDAGQLLFCGSFDTGHPQGLYIANTDGTVDRVVANGDLLPTPMGIGEYFLLVRVGSQSLSNNGAVAFSFVSRVPNGGQRQGIAIATPRVDLDCIADVNDDGAASPADFTAWLACFNNPASAPFCDRADVNGDGSLTPADFTAWLAAFSAGCD